MAARTNLAIIMVGKLELSADITFQTAACGATCRSIPTGSFNRYRAQKKAIANALLQARVCGHESKDE